MFQPFADRLLVKYIPVEEEESLIETLEKKEIPGPYRGEVLAVGPGTKGCNMEAKVGDIILYTKHTGFDEEMWPDMEGQVIVMHNTIIGKE